MTKLARIALFCLMVVMLLAVPAMAQVPGTSQTPVVQSPAGGWISFSGAFGAGLVTMGAAYGIGKLASSALESMARQPEVAGNIQTAMIIAAALIEGFTFFALFICMQQNPWG